MLKNREIFVFLDFFMYLCSTMIKNEVMEAPEKIYIDDPTGEFDDHWSMYQNDNSIEYTRTDAFVEKVCVKLKKLMYDNLMFQGRLHREEVIDNFVEDFKNYIKGE